jgi:hypothetical protein
MGLGGIDLLIWLRTGTDGDLLYMRQRTFGCHKMRGISWLAEDISQEELCTMELFSKFAYTLRRSPWTADQLDARTPRAQNKAQTIVNAPSGRTTPVFKRRQTVRAKFDTRLCILWKNGLLSD